jgi:hypothetical protein
MLYKKLYFITAAIIVTIVFGTAALCNSCGALPVLESGDNTPLVSGPYVEITDNIGSIDSSPETSEKTEETGISDKTDDTIGPDSSDEITSNDPPDVTATESVPDISSDGTTDDSQTPETTASGNEAPAINLVIYEGPSYSAADDLCYYRVRADVTGKPMPDIVFNRDDSNGTLGPNKTQVNIRRGQPFSLQVKAKNSEGEAIGTLLLSWGCGEENRPPVVKEIIPSDPDIIVNIDYGIFIEANDPDGDVLSYNWTVSAGTLSDNNKNLVLWKAPAIEGDCILAVTVSDGKGHTVNRTKKVKVSLPAPITEYLEIANGEGGVVEDGVSVANGSNLYAGDSINDKACAGFISFDISRLMGAIIQNAAISFICTQGFGDPTAVFDELCLSEYYWGVRPLKQQDCFAPGNLIASYSIATFGCDDPALKNAIQEKIDSGLQRFQLRIYFSGPLTDNDHQADGWMYSQDNVRLKITYIFGG